MYACLDQCTRTMGCFVINMKDAVMQRGALGYALPLAG